MTLMAQWDQYPYFIACSLGEHVMTTSFTFSFHAHLIYHTCIAVF